MARHTDRAVINVAAPTRDAIRGLAFKASAALDRRVSMSEVLDALCAIQGDNLEQITEYIANRADEEEGDDR